MGAYDAEANALRERLLARESELLEELGSVRRALSMFRGSSQRSTSAERVRQDGGKVRPIPGSVADRIVGFLSEHPHSTVAEISVGLGSPKHYVSSTLARLHAAANISCRLRHVADGRPPQEWSLAVESAAPAGGRP